MPDYSLMKEAFGDRLDPETPAGRFNRRVAVVVLAGEPDPTVYESREAVVQEQVGDWVLQEDGSLGQPRTVDGSIGRGAEGWAPVVEWGVNAIGEGIIDLIIAAGAAELVRRLRRRGRDDADEQVEAPLFYISRGTAAAVAADHVANTYDEAGPLEVEAVEEPSGIAGIPVSEVSYVGIEPWVVLLRNVEQERRYYVVVAPDGQIMGDIRTPFLEWEEAYLYREP
jgi:hypothetical protein